MNELSRGDFHGSRDILNAMYALGKESSGVSLMEIGYSVMGAPILAAGIGRGTRRVILTAAHHANEWLTALVLLRFLCETAKSGNSEQILKSNSLCFIPLINPDGVNLVTGALNSGEYYEAAEKIALDYPEIPFPDGWKANILGTDLNLQYPTRWQEARRLKFASGTVSPAPRDFVGFSPLSAPEAKALASFTEDYAPNLLVALHSQGEEIYHMSGGYCPEGTFPLARQIADAGGYRLIETPAFSDNAGYKDWFIEKFDRPGFTLEIGLGENPLPISDFEGVYAKTAPMLKLCATGKAAVSGAAEVG